MDVLTQGKMQYAMYIAVQRGDTQNREKYVWEMWSTEVRLNSKCKRERLLYTK
jgi:hypothetical protein